MILIIGAGHIGQGLARCLTNTHQLFSHTDDWKYRLFNDKPKLVVNAAGLTGMKKCEAAGEVATMNANVDFAYDVMRASQKAGVRCLLISTGAVYDKPNKTPKRESDVLYAPNLYVESKIAMENACVAADTVIFRISNAIGDGSHPNDYHNRIRSWSWVADTYVSTLSMPIFVKALYALAYGYPSESVDGIFNVADLGFKHLPSYARQFHETPITVREQDALSPRASISHILDTTKAQSKGLLHGS